VIHSESPSHTELIGGVLAGSAYGGLLIVLSGDLGAGKTALVRAIGQALGVSDIKSPTFAIESVHSLPGRGFKLVHADLYRLDAVNDGSETALQLEEYLSETGGRSLLLVEWGERWENSQTTDRWDVIITQPREADDELTSRRDIEITAYGMEAISKMALAHAAILDIAASSSAPAIISHSRVLKDDDIANDRGPSCH
jgi:tRNA threonylcarbamoyladenosine biosynthesis protein TsaE